MSIKGSTSDIGQTAEAPLEPETLATHQEAVPVPLLFGTRSIALRWLTDPIDVFSVQAKDARPGKK